MAPLEQIQAAIQQLTREELTTFRDWFAEFDAEQWDQQLEEDVAMGRLDALADEAIKSIARRKT
jgi:hypothetical protein